MPLSRRRRHASGFEVDSSRRQRELNQRQSGTGEREYSITINLGGFTGVGVPWDGTSPEDVRNSFLEFLFNHDEFGIMKTEPGKFFRSLHVNFNGKNMLLTFRTNWITGFTVG